VGSAVPGKEEVLTSIYRKFSGMNQTDARTAIADEEFNWLENAIPIGQGNIKLVPAQGAAVATLTGTTVTMFGYTLKLTNVETPVLICFKSDGSAQQVRLDTFAVTTIGAAGTFTAAARTAIWQDTPVLIADPTKGYFSWDGTTLTTIDATKKATDIAVFEGRAWLVTAPRTITFTSPNTFNDFTGANGSGSVTISDSAFTGNIVRLLSALEQLWIVGNSAVDAITNVSTTGTPLTTTFSLTNIVSNVGSPYPSSVNAFFRTFIFLNHYGVYAVVGATPQKLSDKLDGLFPSLSLTGADNPSATFSLYDIFHWAVLVTLVDPFARGTFPAILMFSQGKWFIARQGDSLKWITGVPSTTGDPQVWGTDGTNIYQLFAASSTTTVPYLIKTKLFDFGEWTQQKHWDYIGLEFTSQNTVVNPTLNVENERQTFGSPALVSPTNVLQFIGAGGVPLNFVGTGTIVWVSSGLQLLMNAASIGIYGHYFGFTMTGTEAPWTWSSYAFGTIEQGRWQHL